jgi:hypothetical protein
MDRRTVNLITGFDQINGDYGFIKPEVRMAICRKSLCPSRGRPWELAKLKIGLPIISFQRGLETGLGFKEGPQHDVWSGEVEIWCDAKRALVGLCGRERSPPLPGAENRALVPVRW